MGSRQPTRLICFYVILESIPVAHLGRACAWQISVSTCAYAWVSAGVLQLWSFKMKSFILCVVSFTILKHFKWHDFSKNNGIKSSIKSSLRQWRADGPIARPLLCDTVGMRDHQRAGWTSRAARRSSLSPSWPRHAPCVCVCVCFGAASKSMHAALRAPFLAILLPCWRYF
jgi:hypothetical protein